MAPDITTRERITNPVNCIHQLDAFLLFGVIENKLDHFAFFWVEVAEQFGGFFL